MRHRLGASRPHCLAGREMVPQARSWGKSLAQAAAALWAVVAFRTGAAAARTGVVGLVVVVLPHPARACGSGLLRHPAGEKTTRATGRAGPRRKRGSPP